MIAIDDVLRALGQPECPEPIRNHWEESMACLPVGGLPLLDPARIAGHARFGGHDEEVVGLLLATADRVRADENLTRLAWHCYRLTFEHPEAPAGWLRAFPALTSALGDAWGLFYLLVALEAVPRTKAFHAARGVPENITRDTLRDLLHHSRTFRAYYGPWGLRQRTLYWFRNHTEGRLYRLGRIQFMVQPQRPGAIVLRHDFTGAVVALAEPGQALDADGYLNDGATAPDRRDGGWTTSFIQTADAIEAHPIDPRGMIRRPLVRLSRAEWTTILAPGDPVLEMHIPEGGAMTLEAIGDSMRQALDFFPLHFPDRPYRAYACNSWIFNTQLEEDLPESANLVRFMRQVYLYPARSDGRIGLYFIFGNDEIDRATAPRDTSVRRAMLNILDSGRGLRNGAMFYLIEDLDRLGGEPYRRDWPPAPLREQLT